MTLIENLRSVYIVRRYALLHFLPTSVHTARFNFSFLPRRIDWLDKYQDRHLSLIETLSSLNQNSYVSVRSYHELRFDTHVAFGLSSSSVEPFYV